MNFEEIKKISLNNIDFIYKKVDEFIGEYNLKFLPKIYYICGFKVKTYEDRCERSLINFNENYIEIDLGKTFEKFQYNYLTNKINKPIEFFFSLSRKGCSFPEFDKILEKCKLEYSLPNPNVEIFRTKGLRNLLSEAHDFKLNIFYHDYLSIIKGFEDEFYITEEEFNSLKKDFVGDYVTDRVIKMLKL